MIKKLIIILFFSLKCWGEEILLYLIQYSRHGARYPALKGISWNQLPMDLTAAGMRQHYLLGTALRNRYIIEKGFLDLEHNPEQMIVQSTRTTRTIVSAYSQLAGLYPPGRGSLLNVHPGMEKIITPPNEYDYIPWINELGNNSVNHSLKIIPVRTMGEAGNPLLESQLACSSIEKMVSQYKTEHKEELNAFDFQNRKLYKEVADVFNITQKISLDALLKLRNVLICGLTEGVLNMNDKYVEDLIKRTAPLYRYAKHNNYLDVAYEGYQVRKLMATPFLKNVKESFLKVIRNKTNMKYEMYVGSDTLMHGLLSQLRYGKETKEAPFTSLLLFELLLSNGSYFARVYYNREVNITYTIEEFVGLIDEITYSDEVFLKYCNMSGIEERRLFWIPVLAAIAVFAILGLFIIIKKMKYRKWELAQINDQVHELETHI